MDKEESNLPTITLNRDRFSSQVGRNVSVKELEKWLPWLGTDTEEVTLDSVKIEYNPNRVDFCSYSGIARAFQGLKGWKTGLPKFNITNINAISYNEGESFNFVVGNPPYLFIRDIPF